MKRLLKWIGYVVGGLALRTGVRPDGRILSAVMPWPYTKNLTDDEIRAMWLHVKTLSPRSTGG